MTDHTEPNMSATQNASQEEDTNNDEGTPANKKPRIDNGELGRVLSNEDVIVIDDTPSVPPPSSTGDEAVNNDNAVQIKRDPGGTTAAAAAATTADDDSDIEIISPSRLKKNNKPSRNDNINLEDNDEEIQITSSTLTAPNVDFPHHRSNCGVHSFTPSSTNNSDNVKFCPNCYCLVCDVPASECKEWDSNISNPTVGPHCHAHEKDEKWSNLLKAKRNNAANNTNAAAATTNRPPPRNPYQRNSNSAPSHTSSNHQQIEQLIHNEFLSRLATDNNTNTNGNSNNNNRNREEQRTRTRREMRITEVLAENFQKALKIHDENGAAAAASNNNGNGNNVAAIDLTSPAVAATTSSDSKSGGDKCKMEGDIPSLSLTNFFVMGIKIGWPYPTVMSPQRQMAFHLIKALNSSKHVVLESPTGTGKSAAILCSVLAWQRHHWKKSGEKKEKVKIIYCSRTHSQVAQMVVSLKQTPYRPRMAILGSRDRLCIHKSIKPRGGSSADEVKGVNVNNECRMRVRNTEKQRKHQLQNPTNGYDDDDPPGGPGDSDIGQQQQPEGGEEGGGEAEENSFLSRSKTCPHYRQLTTSRVANLVHSQFIPSKNVDCCSLGGAKSKYGAHDIEDLVKFGVDPYVQRDIALYRNLPTDSLGLALKKGAGNKRGCFIKAVRENTPAAMNGSLKAEDRIIRVNGNDVFNSDPAHVSSMIKGIKTDPVVLDVTRGGLGTLSKPDDSYSSHAACPYYVSQMLSKDAEIIFAPYNYVLDPAIREAMGIELANSVVVLDEAHNVETVLRDAGSGRFGEIDLCELIVMLNNYAIMEKSTGNLLEVEDSAAGETETAHLCEVAHTLLLFVEKIVMKLREDKAYFERNPGKKGAAQALRDWEKFHTSDDTDFDITFDGPTGQGRMGKAVGCRPFFDKLGLTEDDFLKLCTFASAFEKYIRGRDGDEGSTERDRISNLVDSLMELVGKLNSAIKESCHYYVAVVASANGSLEYAANGEVDNSDGGRRSKRKPKAIPLIHPRTEAHPNRPPNPCMNQYCRAQCTDVFNPIRHGSCCDGSKPRWEAFLCLNLLTPGPLMQQLSNECRTVVLASGSLAPIPSLCAELNLFPADESPAAKSAPSPMNTPNPKIQKRLQNKPAPLEAGHVIDLEKQLRCISIGHFPDGSELKVSHQNYKHDEFLEKLGDSLVKIVEGIPEGGVLVFFPSYALLRKCERLWNPNSRGAASFWMSLRERDYPDETSVWSRLKAAKHNVVVESSGSQEEFEARKEEYMNSVKALGGCILLAVYRGKMSEGISFNDNNARGVVCIGLPLPSTFVLPIKVKMDYNDEQRKIHQRTDLLPGREWYQQQAYRAIAQALGRCIRHIADYGAIFLLDIRHCDDGSPNNGCPTAHANLPCWMRNSVRNLSRNAKGRSPMLQYTTSSSSDILGGWDGLKPELRQFFKTAKPYAAGVLSKSREKITASPCPPLPSNTAAPKPTVVGQKPPIPPSAAKISKTSVQTKPSVPSQSSSTSSNTLQAMFRKQQEMATTNEGVKKPSIQPTAKKPNTPMNLMTMFERQRAASSTQEEPSAETPPSEDTEVTAGDDTSKVNPSSSTATATAIATAIATASHVFKRSPFADPLPAEPLQATVAIPNQQSSQASNMDDDEHLCVVCEDAKKQVIILPCRHMCLCPKCANFDVIKECPMCRQKVEDSMNVFW